MIVWGTHVQYRCSDLQGIYISKILLFEELYCTFKAIQIERMVDKQLMHLFQTEENTSYRGSKCHGHTSCCSC